MSEKVKEDGGEDLKYQREMSRRYCRDTNCGKEVCKSIRRKTAPPGKLEGAGAAI